jgi:hypothetical protein
MKCTNAIKFHRKSGGAQWRDLLFLIRTIESEWKRRPPLCHPDLSVPGFPATMHWTSPRARLSVREIRGTEVEGSAVQRTRPGECFRQAVSGNAANTLPAGSIGDHRAAMRYWVCAERRMTPERKLRPCKAETRGCRQGIWSLSRDGGTGRRSGLKIRRSQGRGGSTPPPGTNKTKNLD